MIRQKIQKILNIPEAEVSRSENEKFGDYSTNIALKLAKENGKNPKEVAEEIIKNLAPEKIFEKIEIAGAGFINFYLSKEFLAGQVDEILKAGEDYGKIDLGKGKKISIDFVSANPTGPVHIGNARGGPLGNVLGNVLGKAGFVISREYYLNDTGNQIEILGHSVLKDEKAQYRGEYIDQLNRKLTGFLKSKDPKKVGEKAADYIVAKIIKPSMIKLGINFDNWISERKIQESGQVNEILESLKKGGFVYEKEGAWWFRALAFGDEKDRAVVKSTGEKTYFGSDIASHKQRLKQGAEKLIDIWGADHHGDINRIKGALEALGHQNKLEIILTQFVRVLKNGQEIKMSKRAGTYISIDDLLDEVGKDATIFFFLMYSPDTHMNFDLDLAKEHSEKNPVYYVQYAHARIHSILAKLKIKNEKLKIADENLKLLDNKFELSLIKQLIRLPEVVEDTARDYQVQRFPQYALDLVRAFHKFYEECRVISEDKEKTQARLGLVEATRIVLKNTLDLMGISAPEKM